MEPNTVLWLLVAFIFKHYIVDFMLQSRAMVENKHKYRDYHGWLHAGLHGLATWLIILHVAHPVAAFVLALMDTVAHHFFDWFKMNVGKEEKFEPTDYGFWQAIGIDQLCHYLTYIVIVAIIVNN